MQSHPIPDGEASRNEAVECLCLLDTPAEERFDRVTRLATRVFQAPIAMVTLIHGQRQWFKSAQGHLLTETPRNESFCQYTIMGRKPLVVTDPLDDPRFSELPAVRHLGVRFYAGVPLKDSTGKSVGTLCVLDVQPRQFSREDLHTLRDLGRCLESELRLEGLQAAEQEMMKKMIAQQRLAATDPVTRGWSVEQTLKLLRKFRTERRHTAASAVAVLEVEVGRVEEVNADFGREAGDLLMRAAANRLRANLQMEMSLGRLPGPRLLVMLLRGGGDSQEQECQALLKQIHRPTLPHPKGSLPIEIFGGYVVESSDESDQELLSRAEEALARAREGGRGTLVRL